MSIALVSDLIYTQTMNTNTMARDLISETICSSQGSCFMLAVVTDLKVIQTKPSSSMNIYSMQGTKLFTKEHPSVTKLCKGMLRCVLVNPSLEHSMGFFTTLKMNVCT